MMTSTFFATLASINHAIESGEVPQSVVQKFSGSLLDYDIQREFFNFTLLDRPEWFLTLDTLGYLMPAVQIGNSSVEQYDSLTWARFLYLRRVASLIPTTQLVNALVRFPLSNPQKLIIAVEIALPLAGGGDERLFQQIIAAISGGTQIFQSDKIADLIVALFTQGQKATAFQLLACVSEVSSENGGPQSRRMDDRNLLDLLERCIPVLTSKSPAETLRLLFGILKSALRSKTYAIADPLRDYSIMWRPAIEDHPQNRTYDLAGSLVSPVRDAAETAITSGAMDVLSVLAILDAEQFLIFKRIRLHVLNAFADRVSSVAKETLLDKELFDDHRFKHEYARFIDNRFDLLEQGEKQQVLSWIQAGPDLDRLRGFVISNTERPPTTEEQAGRVRYWQYEKLWWIRRHLNGEWHDRFVAMQQQFGEPELADLNIKSSGWTGYTSPTNADELKGKALDEIVAYLRQWSPTGSGSSRLPSRQGLGQTLQEAISADVDLFAKNAGAFRELHPVYIQNLLNTMVRAVEQGEQFDYEPVLALCSWVVSRDQNDAVSAEMTPDGEAFQADWSYVLDVIDRFVGALCKKKVDIKFRRKIWNAMPSLRSDPHRSGVVETDNPVDKRKIDYTTQSLNTPRARALHGIMEYAWWVRGALYPADDAKTDLDLLPEVKAVLEKVLADRAEQSPAVFAVFGWWFIRLYLIDRKWTEEHIPTIFDLDYSVADLPLGWGAWNTYLLTQSVFDETFRLLRPQYGQTVALLSQLAENQDQQNRPLGSLALHLMVMYAHKVLSLEDENGLMQQFFKFSTPQLRSHAMVSIGQSLRNDDRLDSDTQLRLKQLWEWYWTNWGSTTDVSALKGYEFGTWFITNTFDDAWCLKWLKIYSDVKPQVEPDSGVLEKVAAIADAGLPDAMIFVDRYVRGDAKHWRVYGSIGELKLILSKVLESGSRQLEEMAVNLIDHLGRTGYREFGELLPVVSSE